MHDAFELEDVVKCRQMVDFNPPAIKAGPDGTSVRRERPWTRPLWRYKCTTKPYVDKAFAVLLGCLGCCIVWSEVVIPVYTRDLSPFSLMIRGLTGEFIFQLLVILPLVSLIKLFSAAAPHPSLSCSDLHVPVLLLCPVQDNRVQL